MINATDLWAALGEHSWISLRTLSWRACHFSQCTYANAGEQVQFEHPHDGDPRAPEARC